MGARVLYGLARQGSLPAVLGSVSSMTRTPVVASALIGSVVYLMAAAVPLRGLAEATSQITLTVFAIVNLALFLIKRRGDEAPQESFIIPIWVPVAGFASCCVFLVVGFV